MSPLFAFAPLIALLPVLKVLAPVAIAAISAWAAYRTDRFVKAKTDNEVVPAALDQFFQVVTKSVLVVQQTFVDDLLEASADGKLTESEKRQALSRAADQVMKMLPPSVEAVLRAYYGERFTAAIEAEIESSVHKIKPHVLGVVQGKSKKASAITDLREYREDLKKVVAAGVVAAGIAGDVARKR